jgi:hypothetical protein
VVSLTQRDSFILEVQKDAELRPLRTLIFGERVGEAMPGNTTRARLFEALRASDARRFEEILGDLERRKLSPDSDWIGDDCVVFLLLLNISKFGVGDPFADRLLQCRGKTTNPQVQQLNHAFDAIRRREFAMEGEMAFIKCVYRTLAESWSPSEADCAKLYKQLTKPGFVEQLDPFLRLLAIRAFDIVIECRSISEEPKSWNQVLQKLQDDGAKLSLVEFVGLLKHLRLGVVVAIVLAFAAVFGAGRTWSWWRFESSSSKRVAPSGSLAIHTQLAHRTNGWTAPFVLYLDGIGMTSTNLTPITLVAESDPFAHPTERFTAKGTFLLASNVNALCFVMHPLSGVTSSIPVEVSCHGNEFSASVPPSEVGDQLRFVIRGLAGTSPPPDALGTALNVIAVPWDR